MSKPDLTPEEKAYMQRIMLGRTIGGDILNLYGRVNTPLDVLTIATFTATLQALIATHKINAEVAQGLVDEFANEFAAVVKRLGLTIGAEPEAEVPVAQASHG